MSKVIIPADYRPALSLYDTQKAIGLIKRLFEDMLCGALNLRRVSSPLFVPSDSGLNDNLNGVERPVKFDVKDTGADAPLMDSFEIVESIKERGEIFVSPDIAQLEARSANRSTLRLMSLISVYNKWIETVLPELRELAAARALRIVKVTDAKFISKTKHGEYWQVSYDLITWDAPNNFSVVPRVESATLFMDISYEPGMRETVLGRSLSQYMESGGDPAVAFKFGVRDIVIQE
jgi:hypothetical protein